MPRYADAVAYRCFRAFVDADAAAHGFAERYADEQRRRDCRADGLADDRNDIRDPDDVNDRNDGSDPDAGGVDRDTFDDDDFGFLVDSDAQPC